MLSGVSGAARFVGLLAVIADCKVARFFSRKESDFSASSAIFLPPCLDFFSDKVVLAYFEAKFDFCKILFSYRQ
jgi:hypothetical protein